MRSSRSLRLLRSVPRVAAGVVFATVLPACTRERAANPELRVGLIGVYEGSARNSSGLPAEQGARLAVDEINAAGGVDIGGVRHRMVLVQKTSANRPDAAAGAARELINLDSVHAVVGPQFSGLAITAGVVAEASEIPLIAPMASSPRVTEGKRFVNRLAFADAVQGEVLARYAFDSLGVRRTAALFNAASEYGRGIVTLFGQTFALAGGRMLTVETYNVDDPHAPTAQIARIVASGPDAVLLPNFTVRDSLQVRLLRDSGFRGRILGSDSWDAIALRGRELINGTIIVGNWDGRSARKAVTEFRSRFAARYPDTPPRATGAATYDAMHLIARAATRAGSLNGPALATALRAPGDYDGAFARYQFNGTGDPARGATLMELLGDSLYFRVTLEPRR